MVVGIVAEGDGDGVGADGVAGGAVQGVGDGIVADGTGNSGGEGWVSGTIGLAVVVGNHRGGFFVDGEDSTRGGHLVVRVLADEGDGDGVVAGVLTCGAGQGEIDNIAPKSAGNGGGEFGVGVTVGLAVVVGGHGDRCRSDGLIAVRHDERHIKVPIIIEELL